MTTPFILNLQPLGNPWPTMDPFLFCVHHLDAYPRGNERMGPDAALTGRNLGQDFAGKDGWSMYHGQTVPGFPAHPHRGFETITIVRNGLIDHSDSLGATARFGQGDVQWLTSGHGIVHCEMFPLVNTHAPNPTELFQIWLNLPAKNKMADPHFTMMWKEDISRRTLLDAAGRATEWVCIAGQWPGAQCLPAPPASWASAPGSDLGICTIHMAAHGQFTLPPALQPDTRRQLYFFAGADMRINGTPIPVGQAIEVRADTPCDLTNGNASAELLVLQARPIGEPVVQHGPFVMNTPAEIHQAIADYRGTEFGGWPWESSDPTHHRTQKRFARHADGRMHSPEP
jgi:quercetin 2,3-dioxygenase